MFVTACLAGYLTGYKIGHNEGLNIWNVIPLQTITYSVSEIIQNRPDGIEPNLTKPDELVKLIKAEVLPVSWLEAGGNGEIQIAEISGKEHLIVSTNSIVHDKVRAYLEVLREEIRP